jgi:hypothetical protein
VRSDGAIALLPLGELAVLRRLSVCEILLASSKGDIENDFVFFF